MLGYLSADIICYEKRTVFRERSSRKTVSYEEQIMSKDKYPSIFSPQMEAIEVLHGSHVAWHCIRKKKIFPIGKGSIVFVMQNLYCVYYLSNLSGNGAAWKIGEYSVT